ncbi:MAG: heavy metal translocating P-type ATPase, partial [Oscillospiraceae bacterium]
MDKEHLHTHSHEHNEEESPIKLIFKIALAAALVLAAHFIPMPYSLIAYVIAYVIVGYEVVINAVHSTFHGELFDENFLMALATIGAFAIGSYSEAVAVMIFYNVGELFQDLAVARSRKNIAQLMDIRPDFAVIVENDIETTVSPDAVSVGDIIRIKPGERVPLDCVVTHGASAVDTSALTGESVPL